MEWIAHSHTQASARSKRLDWNLGIWPHSWGQSVYHGIWSFQSRRGGQPSPERLSCCCCCCCFHCWNCYHGHSPPPIPLKSQTQKRIVTELSVVWSFSSKTMHLWKVWKAGIWTWHKGFRFCDLPSSLGNDDHVTCNCSDSFCMGTGNYFWKTVMACVHHRKILMKTKWWGEKE